MIQHVFTFLLNVFGDAAQFKSAYWLTAAARA